MSHASTMGDLAAAATTTTTTAAPNRGTAQFEAVDAETRAVMQSRINPSSRAHYDHKNIKFILWLFDNREHYSDLLQPDLLDELALQLERDKEQRTQAGNPSKWRDHVRATCRQWLGGIEPSRPETHPIRLTDLDIQVYGRYFNAFKKRVDRRSNGGAQAESVLIRLSQSAFESAAAALAHLYTECGLDKHVVSKNLWQSIANYKQGSRRTSAREKKTLGLSTVEGKKHMPMGAFKKLAKVLYESPNGEHIPAHTFLIFDWNLVSRAEFVVGANIDLVSFSEDALLFHMGVTKTDQEGTKNVDHPWHVYSNPECPEICAHLALARLLMYNPTILNGQIALFEGRAQYERFNRIFRDIVSHPNHREEFAELGISPEDFGTHSIRKGAATHISTGSTACPPIASICLRANWSMPGVLNKYIKFESASDQFVGKCASGRSRNSKKIGASCAYWDFSALHLNEREAREADLQRFLRESLPVQARGNLKIYSIYKMALAALVFYRGHLEEHVHPSSDLRASYLWNATVPSAELVVVKYPWNATNDTPEITGLPPDIILLAEIESLKHDMANLQTDLTSSFQKTLIDQLDQRQVGGSGFAQSNEILEKIGDAY